MKYPSACSGIEAKPRLTSEFVVRRLTAELPKFAYRFADERQFQDGIAVVLTGCGLAFEREKIASAKDRFDFLVEGRVVIEAKINGSFSEAARQAARYLESPDIAAVVVAATSRWARDMRTHRTVKGNKPVHFVSLGRPTF